MINNIVVNPKLKIIIRTPLIMIIINLNKFHPIKFLEVLPKNQVVVLQMIKKEYFLPFKKWIFSNIMAEEKNLITWADLKVDKAGIEVDKAEIDHNILNIS